MGRPGERLAEMRTSFFEIANRHPNRRGPPLRRLGPRVTVSESAAPTHVIGVNSCTHQDLVAADTMLRSRLEAVSASSGDSGGLPYFCIYMADQTTWLEPESGPIEQVGPHDIGLINSEASLHTVSTAGTRHLSLFLPRPLVLARLPWADDCSGQRIKLAPNTLNMAQSLVGMLRASIELESFDAVAPCLVQSLLALLSSVNTCAAAPKGDPLCSVKQQQLTDCIKRHFSNPDLTVESIAKELGISTRYLQRVCKDGESPGEQLRRYRLRMAAACLRNGSLKERSISEICYSCGFSSSSHFSTEFRRFHGVTPREYRS
jgi:AraC family transcriptional activator of tynA and feaB